MSFETEAAESLVEPRYILALTMGVCSLTYGIGACTAGRIFSGTAAAGGPTSITLPAGASADNDAYNGMVISTTGGTGSGQERTVLDYDGGTKVATVATWGTDPDDTTELDIIDRPEACFNTRFTCQDPTNYDATTRVDKYCLNDRQLPITGETIRPLIRKAPLFNVARIDPRMNILQNSSVNIQFLDGADNDIGLDPYLEWREYDPETQSTYWRKWGRRNQFYKGNQAIIKRGFQGMDEGDYSSSEYVIDSFNMNTGEPKMVLKDPLKVLDTTDLPAATDATVVGSVATDTATIPISDASEYKDPAVTSWDEAVLIKENVITYTGISGDNLTGCTWGAFGTEKTALGGGEKVQQCFCAINRNVVDVQEEALNRGGVPDSIINTAGWATEGDLWLQAATMTGVIIKPRAAVKTVQELMEQGMHSIYWDERAGKVQLKALAPPLPTEAIESLNDGVIVGLPGFDDRVSARLSRVFTHFEKKTPIEDAEDIQNYDNNYLILDTDAESPEQYGEPAIDNIFSRWITSPSWARRISNRRITRYLTGAPTVTAVVTHKEYARFELGDLIKLTTQMYTDAKGAPLVDRVMQVVSVQQITDGKFKYILEDPDFDAGGVLGGNYGVIAPNGQPDWDDADTDEMKYAYIGDVANNELGVLNEPGFYIA